MPESLEAVKRAVELARKTRGRVTVLQVIPGLIPNFSGQLDSAAAGLRLRMLYEARFELKRRIEVFAQDGIYIKAKVITGFASSAVITEVLRNRYDLLIVTPDEEYGFADRLFGNTRMQLLRECPCPIWVLKPRRYKHRLRKILAPLDLALFDAERAALDRRIVEYAVSLAQSERGELHFVHAWDLGTSMRAFLSERDAKRLWLQIKASRYEQLDNILKELGLKRKKYRVHLREGEAKNVIPEVAAQQNIDLVVMGTVCRTGFAGFVIGNTAEKVLPEITCSVLALKPEGFAAHSEEPETFSVPGKAVAGPVVAAMSA